MVTRSESGSHSGLRHDSARGRSPPLPAGGRPQNNVVTPVLAMVFLMEHS